MILAHDVSGSGPLLVLIHGITEDRSSWDPIDLTDSFTVLRVDLRGHGASEVTAPYGIPDLAADVHDTVEAVAPGAVPWVVGHSMGGIVATAYGALFPVAGVVNVDQPLHLAGMQEQVLQAEGMLRGEQFPLFIAGMFEQMSGTLDDAEKQRVGGIRAPKQEVVLGMWQPLLEETPEQLGETVAQIAALPLDVPYLAISGLDAGPEYDAWLKELIPQTVHEVWGPPTHYPHLADPERFTARIRGFAVPAP